MPMWLERIPWWRFQTLHIGEKLAFGCLACVVFIGGLAALDRFFAGDFSWPKESRTRKSGKRKKKGLGVKWLMLALFALLPGGLVGMFTLYAIMGKANWRSEALRIVGAAMAPAALLVLLRLENSPWPEMRDSVYVSGLLGLIFGLLHVWALIKLLRQWWGEPDECVPWWPPLALCLQALLLVGAAFRVLAPQ